MTEYIFLPVPTREMVFLAKEITDAYTKAGRTAPSVLKNRFDSGAMKGFMRNIGAGCLRMLGAADTLYLVLHGTGKAGSQVVGARRGLVKEEGVRGNWVAGPGGAPLKQYDPSDIARVLKAEGLPTSFVNLTMLTCGGGLSGGDDPRFVLSIAERVRDALRLLGYNHVKVTGYTGNILAGAGDSFKVTVKNGGGTDLVLPGDAVVTY